MCATRKNENGKLYSLTYGQVSSVAVDPIEKKPLYHFYPCSRVYSVGGWGCNFGCGTCQNHDIAHIVPTFKNQDIIEPEQLVQDAISKQSDGIAFTYNEPAIWPEFVKDTFVIAKKNNLYTALVTNGTFTKTTLDYIGPFCDAYRVDIKGIVDLTLQRIGVTGVDPGEILENTVWARDKWGMHIECVTNIIPGVNDSENELKAIARWIRDSLGPKVPWHVTRFYPALRFKHLMPTDLSKLELAEKFGKNTGLSFIYLGNINSVNGQSTICPRCQSTVIIRDGFFVKQNLTVKGKCTKCGEDLGITQSDGREHFRS
jgi:pyruvate formate lyase activating enzyme